jgi:hypothetical protein
MTRWFFLAALSPFTTLAQVPPDDKMHCVRPKPDVEMSCIKASRTNGGGAFFAPCMMELEITMRAIGEYQQCVAEQMNKRQTKERESLVEEANQMRSSAIKRLTWP